MVQKRIWINTNGNGVVATGHIRRCMTIAEELKKRGALVEFILPDEHSADVLAKLSGEDGIFFDSKIMHTDYSKPMQDLPVLKGYFEEIVPDLLLCDSAYITPEYFTEVQKIVPKDSILLTGYIDDLDRDDYPVNLVINYNIEPGDIYESAAHKLLGAEFAPLREQFCQFDYNVSELGKRAFLSSGGTDPCHVIGKLLTEIYEGDSPYRKTLDITGIECEVIVGALFEPEYVYELSEFAKRHTGITLHDYVEDMAELMGRCDFAVSAGGSTLYELCAIGVPTVVYSMTDAQAELVESFDRIGAAKYAGDARYDHRLVQKIVTWGTAAIDNRGFRSRMSKKARNIVDGKGVYKIADAIFKILK